MGYPNGQPRRYTNTNNIGKSKDTGVLISTLVKQANVANAIYFNDPNLFLSTSTSGFTLSAFDLSNRVASEYDLDISNTYQSLPVKPYLETLTRPYTLAGSANAQIDVGVTIDLVTNDTIMFSFVANYAAANVVLRLASDTGFSNTASWTITGSSVNTGTTLAPKYETTVLLKTATATLSSTAPDLSKMIRARVIGVNQTTSNRVAPVQILNGNNVDSFPGQIISQSLCCAENPIDKIITETEKIKCGTATIGETITDQSVELDLSVQEENPRFLALMYGRNSTIETIDAWKHLTGYEVGQTVNKVVADDVEDPSRGQIQLSPNLNIKDVVIGCASLSVVAFEYVNALPANANTFLGSGEYSYDKSTGIMYFNVINIGKTPEIKVSDSPIVELITPQVGKLPDLMSTVIQDKDRTGKRRIVAIRALQFKSPERSVEATGHKLDFKATGYFSKTGDIKYGYEL